MQIELTEQQQQILGALDGELLRVVNPRTNETFVLMPANEYERLKSILDGRFNPQEAYPLVDRIMAEDDANDPYLQTYQNMERENPA
jgi:hypothetical protein